jgi:hypothetical protein
MAADSTVDTLTQLMRRRLWSSLAVWSSMGGNQYEMGVWIKSGRVPPLMIAPGQRGAT